MIFCGGQGMRLQTGTFSERLPKPMASIGGRPLLWHLMKYYAALRAHRVRALPRLPGRRDQGLLRALRNSPTAAGTFDFVDTGIESSIGERFAHTRDHIGDRDVFLASYGDTLTDAPLPLLIAAHEASGKIASLLAAGRTTRST